MADEPNELAYVARRPCACLCFAATLWAYENDPETRRELAACMKEGLSIERVKPAEVRGNPWGCDKCKPAQTDLFAETARA